MFDPAALLAELDGLGLKLQCVRLANGELALAPWGSAGGAEAQKLLLDACVSSQNRVALLQYLHLCGRESPR